MKDYVKRAIDNYREKNRDAYLVYQKQYRLKHKDVRSKEFKTLCRMNIFMQQ